MYFPKISVQPHPGRVQPRGSSPTHRPKVTEYERLQLDEGYFHHSMSNLETSEIPQRQKAIFLVSFSEKKNMSLDE